MYQLKEQQLQVALDSQGGLAYLQSENGVYIAFTQDELRVETDYGCFSTADAPMPEMTALPHGLALRYDAGAYGLTLRYVIDPDKSYLRRYISIDNPGPLALYRITVRQGLAQQPTQVLDYNTFWNCPTVAFIRYEDCGLYTGFEHPFFSVTGDRRRVENTFEPALLLKAGQGYVSEANFFGVYRRTGQMLTQQTPATTLRYNDVHHTRYRNPCGHISLDRAEVETFQAYARDYLELRVDEFKLIFYQFFIPLPQQPDTDEDEQLYRHYLDNFVKMGGDLVTFNPLVRNAPPVPDAHSCWELMPAGSRAERIVSYAKQQGLDIGFYMGSAAGNSAYCTSPMVPFGYDSVPAWKKLDRNGHYAGENCIASDEFAEWFLQAQSNTIEKFGLTLWDWDPGPGNGFFCYSDQHGHVPGKGAYKGFRNAMSIVKRLKERFPRLYIQGFHGTKEYGLWGFRGFDQHECYWEQDLYWMATAYPDFSEDRLTASGMRFQSAWNQLFRFMPPETNHALASKMTQNCCSPAGYRKLYDELGWEYTFFSALAVGASMTVTMMPFDVEKLDHGRYLAAFKKWIPWARENFSYARYIKPFGAQVACGAMDGYARVKDDHGFLFLFNPGPVTVNATFGLDDEIGLNVPGCYQLEWLHPMEHVRLYDTVAGKWVFAHGDKVHMQLAPFSATLLELKRAEQETGAVLCNLPGRLKVVGEQAEITDCIGQEGSAYQGVILGAKVKGVTVNGTDIPCTAGEVITFDVCFGNALLPRSLERWRCEDEPFPILRHPACGYTQLHSTFKAPGIIRQRLQSYAPEDAEAQDALIQDLKRQTGRKSFGWAQPHRLHLMLPFAHVDHVQGLQARLNGRALSLELCSSWADDTECKVLYYADITDAVLWDGDNALTLSFDAADADSFMGARLDYPMGEDTTVVSACIAPQPVTSSEPIGLPRQLLPPAPGMRKPVVHQAWIVDGVIEENHPYTLCASVNLPREELEGVYASAQVSIDDISGPSLRADQRLEYDERTKLWKRTLKPGSRRLLIIDGMDIHIRAVTKDGVVSEPLRIPCEWRLQGY